MKPQMSQMSNSGSQKGVHTFDELIKRDSSLSIIPPHTPTSPQKDNTWIGSFVEKLRDGLDRLCDKNCDKLHYTLCNMLELLEEKLTPYENHVANFVGDCLPYLKFFLFSAAIIIPFLLFIDIFGCVCMQLISKCRWTFHSCSYNIFRSCKALIGWVGIVRQKSSTIFLQQPPYSFS
jgi:hypothetical protein